VLCEQPCPALAPSSSPRVQLIADQKIHIRKQSETPKLVNSHRFLGSIHGLLRESQSFRSFATHTCMSPYQRDHYRRRTHYRSRQQSREYPSSLISIRSTTMSGNKLCAKCEDIISIGPPENTSWPWKRAEHHADSRAFLRAVEQGCYICTWSWRRYSMPSYDGPQTTHTVHHTTYE
jgi:hypothetical protein